MIAIKRLTVMWNHRRTHSISRPNHRFIAIFLLSWIAPTHAADRKPDAMAMVSMSDDTRLATDIYLPSRSGSWPVRLICTPYGRTQYAPLSDEGYAIVIQDMRGRYGSQG